VLLVVLETAQQTEADHQDDQGKGQAGGDDAGLQSADVLSRGI
jgi:hypothetical protein